MKKRKCKNASRSFIYQMEENGMPTRHPGEELNELHCFVNAMKPIMTAKLDAQGYSGEPIVSMWFHDLRLEELSESEAVFSTTTDLRKRIIDNRYIDLLGESLREVIGFPVAVRVVVNSVTPREVREAREAEERRAKDEEKRERERQAILAGDYDYKEEEEEVDVEKILETEATQRSVLDDYTFENFIEGASNRFARAACFAVAKEPTTYNPLFIWGESGLGKTHLLYAVINYIRKKHPGMKIVYKKSEEFINELIAAISNGTTAEFKDSYRTADILLIDDIQFIAGKESTQEEFFHTFSALYESDKQIILTSDRPPKDIKPLEDRLRTRFEGGLIADIQPPSFELRLAIIASKAKYLGFEIDPQLVSYMAERLHDNVRQIEGVVKKLYAIHSLSGVEITREHVDQAISFVDPGNVPASVIIDRVLREVSEQYGISVDDLTSKRKTDTIANARHTAIYLIRTLTDVSLKKIGEIFNRDHSTVLSSLQKSELNIKTVNGYDETVQKLIKKIREC